MTRSEAIATLREQLVAAHSVYSPARQADAMYKMYRAFRILGVTDEEVSHDLRLQFEEES